MRDSDPKRPSLRVRPAISIVVPVFRNLRHLPALHARLGRALAELNGAHEVIFVEDAGRDGSLEWLRMTAAQDPTVRLVALARNIGQHGAILHGISRCRAPAVVVMDADLQDPPEVVPQLLSRLAKAGNRVVFGTSLSPRGTGARRITGHLFKRLLGGIAGSRLPRGSGVFTAMTRETARRVVGARRHSSYLPLLLILAGARMAAVPVPRELRLASESGYTTLRRARLAARVLAQAAIARIRRRASSDARPTAARRLGHERAT